MSGTQADKRAASALERIALAMEYIVSEQRKATAKAEEWEKEHPLPPPAPPTDSITVRA